VALEITDTFSEPYSQSTAALPSSFSPSVVGIAGVPYLIDNESGRYARQAFDVVQQRNTTDARDVLLLPQDVWRQQAYSWNLGAGQGSQDRDNSLPFRYEDSFGIDPWEQWQIGLLPETRKMGTYSGDTLLTLQDEYLAVVNGESVYWYDSPSASAPVGSTVIYSGHPVVDIADDGHILTTLHDNGYIYITPGVGSTPAQYSNQQFTNATFIAWQKDFLLVGDEHILKWVKKSNQSETIYTHPDTSFRWYAAAEGNSCIYVIGRVGSRTTIHRLGIKEDATGLRPAVVAATLPDGELGYTIDSYLSYVLIGTDKGVRVATPNNDAGDLTLGPIIPTLAPVRCFEGQDRFVWYGNSAMTSTYSNDDDYFPVGTVAGLGRMDLSVATTTALTPAYANDLAVLNVSTGTVQSVVTFEGKRVFSISGSGVHSEGDVKVQSGWLKQGAISYSIEDLKTALYLQANWVPLCAGTISLDLAYDNTGYIRVVDLNVIGRVRSGNINLNGTQFSRVDARFRLDRCSINPAVSPVLTRWEIRSIPVKGRASRWTLPIMNYEDIEIDGVMYKRNPQQVLDTLINLVQSGQLFILQESGRAYQVHGKDFVWQPEKLSINGKAWQGICTLVVEEVS
jgi:hypothetical protein